MTRVSAAVTTMTHGRVHQPVADAAAETESNSAFAALLDGVATVRQGGHANANGAGSESDGGKEGAGDDPEGADVSGLNDLPSAHHPPHSVAPAGATIEASAGAIAAASLIVTSPSAALAASTRPTAATSSRHANDNGTAAPRTLDEARPGRSGSHGSDSTPAAPSTGTGPSTAGHRSTAAAGKSDATSSAAVAAAGLATGLAVTGLEAAGLAATGLAGAGREGARSEPLTGAATPQDPALVQLAGQRRAADPTATARYAALGQDAGHEASAATTGRPLSLVGAGNDPPVEAKRSITVGGAATAAEVTARQGADQAQPASGFSPPDWQTALSAADGSAAASHALGARADVAARSDAPLDLRRSAAADPTTQGVPASSATSATTSVEAAGSLSGGGRAGATAETGEGDPAGAEAQAVVELSAGAAQGVTQASRRVGDDESASANRSAARSSHDVPASSTSQPASSAPALDALLSPAAAPTGATTAPPATAAANESSEPLEAPVRLDHLALATAISAPVTNSDGSHSLSAVLTPPELGSVHASVRVDGTSVAVTLVASSDAGHRALSANLGQLATALGHNGRDVQVTLAERSERGAGSGDDAGGGSGTSRDGDGRRLSDAEHAAASDRDSSGGGRNAAGQSSGTQGSGSHGSGSHGSGSHGSGSHGSGTGSSAPQQNGSPQNGSQQNGSQPLGWQQNGLQGTVTAGAGSSSHSGADAAAADADGHLDLLL